MLLLVDKNPKLFYVFCLKYNFTTKWITFPLPDNLILHLTTVNVVVLDNRKEPEKMLCLLINHYIPETINITAFMKLIPKIISGFQKLLKNHNNDNSIIVVQPTVAKVDDGKNAILFLFKPTFSAEID